MGTRWPHIQMKYCNAMFEILFDVYQNKLSPMKIWDALEAKYFLEKDTASKKYLVVKIFQNYKMVDSRPITKYFNEIMHTID